MFFVDRCLGRRLAEALREAGFKVEIHEDHFADDAPDEEWIPKIGSRGWVVLTKDKNIRRKPAERGAVITSGLRMFTLSHGSMNLAQMIEIFVKNRLAMGRFLMKTAAPFAARVSVSGVERISLGE